MGFRVPVTCTYRRCILIRITFSGASDRPRNDKLIRKQMQENFEIRHNWTVPEIEALLKTPLLDLVWQAQNVHRQYQDDTVQLASLLSIKTGGCPEDCAYCPQSAHYTKETGVAREPLMPV